MDLAEFLFVKGSIVEDYLKKIFSSFDDAPRTLCEAMEYSVFSPGKRIRPVLAIAACEALGGISETVLPFACAIEMIHTYSLIHDDLPAIDNDDLRRGRPTNHKIFGEPMAILAGDALLTEAFRVVADPVFTKGMRTGRVKKIFFEIAKAAGSEGMVGGQAVDVLFDGKKGTKRTLKYIHTHKTMMLIRLSVRVGAIMAGAKTQELKYLTKYGESIGLAFQIMDDLLDAVGDEGKVGKKLRKDITKQTYIRHYGVYESKKRIGRLTADALTAVEFLGERGRILKELAEFIGNRAN